jgi:hypothetical protein
MFAEIPFFNGFKGGRLRGLRLEEQSFYRDWSGWFGSDALQSSGPSIAMELGGGAPVRSTMLAGSRAGDDEDRRRLRPRSLVLAHQ